MIRLRPMSEDEFPGYLEYFIPDYAEEIAANYRLSLNDAFLRAKQEIAEDLPEGQTGAAGSGADAAEAEFYPDPTPGCGRQCSRSAYL